jgi:hypothetical protein
MNVGIASRVERWFAETPPHMALLSSAAVGVASVVVSRAPDLHVLPVKTNTGSLRQVAYFRALTLGGRVWNVVRRVNCTYPLAPGAFPVKPKRGRFLRHQVVSSC